MSKHSLGLLAAAVVFLCSVVMVPPVSGQRNGGAADLPDGPGKDAVAQTCTVCHGINNISDSWGYTKAGWKELFGSMVKVPDGRAEIIATYLAAHYPEKPRPKSVVIPGDAKVNIREWVAPTLGSRPHDPLAASDGTIWWAGMWGNVIGHLDPKTGAIKEYPLKTPKSGPHGITEARDGMIWFTANTGALRRQVQPEDSGDHRISHAGSGGA